VIAALWYLKHVPIWYDEHRLVYRADDKEVKILKARYHYSD
jgi:hypothetical protein